MDVTVYSYATGDPVLIDRIVNEFLSQGKFDKLRKECMADADTKPAYQNLQQRVESTVSQFLRKQIWKPDLNKNQLRDSLRKHILESGFLDAGINRIVDQIVNPNVLATVFMPEVEEVVYNYLSIPRPGDKLQRQCDSLNKTALNNRPKTPETTKDELDYRSKPQKNGEIRPATPEKIRLEENLEKNCSKIDCTTDLSTGGNKENGAKEQEVEVKQETEDMITDHESNYIKEECKFNVIHEDACDSTTKLYQEKMELPSDESQESLSRMGVERLRISESDGLNVPDSDASLPLEINEKSMSDSRDSDDSIMNKMSPISQGRLTPEDLTGVDEIIKEEKQEKEEKKPLTFIGRIPKIKRDDSESSKSSKKEETSKLERSYKSVFSSDESDSSKHSISKSDSDDKRSKDKKRSESDSREKYEKSDRKYKDADEKRRKSDHHKSSSSDGKSHSKDGRNRDEKSRSRRDEKDKSHSHSREEKRDKSRDKNSSGDKKSSSSSSSSHSRTKGSSHHRSVHKSGSHDKEHHRDRSRERSRHDRKDKDKRDFDKRKKDEEKRKKSKNVDDHGKERNKRDDRRSTDRDSNERERDKTKDSSGRPQPEAKRKDKDHKTEEGRKEKNQREESDQNEEKSLSCKPTTDSPEDPVEATNVTLEVECVNEVAAANVEHAVTEEETKEADVPPVPQSEEVAKPLDVRALCEEGALARVQFPKLVDDFYVKFDSTGFRYFEDWETTKLDCEEEFKEYIDEAEKDLSLLSDDGSDYEGFQDHVISDERNLEIVRNSLRGLGNFQKSLIFDPDTYEFYTWASGHHYMKHRNPGDRSDAKRDNANWEPTEEDEIHMAEKNKENRGRGRKIRKNIKFFNHYHSQLGLKFKHGKDQHKFVRRQKKHFVEVAGEVTDVNGIKIKNLQEWNKRKESEKSVTEYSIPGSPRVVVTKILKRHNEIEENSDGSREPSRTSDDSVGVDDIYAEEITVEENFTVEEGESEQVRNVEIVVPNDEIQRTFAASAAPKMDVEAKIRLYQIQSQRRSRCETSPHKSGILARLSSGSKGDLVDDEPEVDENEIHSVSAEEGLGGKKNKRRGIRLGLPRPRPRIEEMEKSAMDAHKKINANYNLPLSPESDDSTFSNNSVMTARKRGVAFPTGVAMEIPAKKPRRYVSQKYESQDLYKPRPFFGSTTRGRALKAEDNFGKIGTGEK